MEGEKAIPGILTQEEEKLFDAVRVYLDLKAKEKIVKTSLDEAKDDLVATLQAMGRKSYMGCNVLIEIEEKQTVKITGYPVKPGDESK